MTTPEFTLLENGLRKPLLETIQKYGKQKYTLWTVWTYMKWRSNDDIFSLPENLVREDLGIDLNVLRAARAILIKEGWLEKDVLRDTGGEYLTRTWIVTAPPSVYASMGMEPPRIFTTTGKSPYSGSCSSSVSCSDSSSSSFAATATPSDSNKTESLKGVPLHSENIKAKSKPENLEPEPAPRGLHGQKANGQAKKVRYAPDGTPWPMHFNSWTNGEWLEWLVGHGWKQDGVVGTSSQKTPRSAAEQEKPTPTAAPMHDPPGSAIPPAPNCVRCHEPCTTQQGEWVCHPCHLRQPVVRPPEPELDNWDEL
jgi:hypothetical protein